MANRLASKNAADEGLPNPRETIGGNNPPKVHELLASELAETYRLELAKIDVIAQRANDAPEKVESEEHLKLWTTIYLDAAELFKKLDASRLNEQRPLLAVFKAVFAPTERLTRITDAGRKVCNDYNREKLRREREEQAAELARLREKERIAREDAQIAAEFGDTDTAIEHVQTASQAVGELAAVKADAPTIAEVARVRTDDGGMSTAKGEWKFEIIDIQKVDLNALRPYFTVKEIEKAVGAAVRKLKEHTKIEGVRAYEDVATQFRR